MATITKREQLACGCVYESDIDVVRVTEEPRYQLARQRVPSLRPCQEHQDEIKAQEG